MGKNDPNKMHRDYNYKSPSTQKHTENNKVQGRHQKNIYKIYNHEQRYFKIYLYSKHIKHNALKKSIEDHKKS